MPRTTNALQFRYWKMSDLEEYRFWWRRQPVLRDYVSAKQEKTSKAVCVSEMTKMLECFKRVSFDETACAKEVTLFRTCVQKEEHALQKKKADEAKGVYTFHRGKLPTKRMNELIRQYPTPRDAHKRPVYDPQSGK